MAMIKIKSYLSGVRMYEDERCATQGAGAISIFIWMKNESSSVS
jgi:hypothetical protein